MLYVEEVSGILHASCDFVNKYVTRLLCYVLRSRLTIVSCEAKKKQHACTSFGLRDYYSELFTRMAALKF